MDEAALVDYHGDSMGALGAGFVDGPARGVEPIEIEKHAQIALGVAEKGSQALRSRLLSLFLLADELLFFTISIPRLESQLCAINLTKETVGSKG